MTAVQSIDQEGVSPNGSADVAMNSAMLTFLQEKVFTFPRWDLVRFFHYNPHAAEIAESLAPHISRDVGEVSSALAGLAEDSVLTVQTVNGRQVYRLTNDETMRAQVAAFAAACDDPDFRRLAIQNVIEMQK